MGVLRRVESEQAGPGSLGILIPPARRTFVILRPRSLPWDVLLCRGPDDPGAFQLTHDEASAAAQALFRGLRDWAAGGTGSLEPVRIPDGCWLRLSVAGFTLVVCPRLPGQPYAPLVCPASDAPAVIEELIRVLRPPEGAAQDVYFNTRFFERQDPR